MNLQTIALLLTNHGRFALYFTAATILASSSVAQPVALTNDPAITQQPQSVNLLPRATANFAVRAAGTQPLFYQWRLDGTNIPGATATNLVITNVQAADAGFYSVVVSNNVGSILSSNALLRLPTVAGKGQYAGLFADSASPTNVSSGSCVFSFSKDGLFTVKLQSGAQRYSGASMLDTFGGAQFTATASSAVPPLSVAIQLAPGDTNTLVGLVWSENFAPVPLLARRIVGKELTRGLGPRFTMVLRPSEDATNLDAGSGCLALRINSSGRLTFNGFSGDGSPVSGSSWLTTQLRWPLYFPLYHGKGFALGWLTITGSLSNFVEGALFWAKSGSTNAAQADGFAATNTVYGSRYVPPAKGERALELSTATLLLQKNGLAQPITTEVQLDARNKLALSSSVSAHPVGAISRATGLLKATITDIGGLHKVMPRGVVLQNTNQIEGFFTSDKTAGFMSISAGQ